MKLVDLKTNLKSLKYGSDRPGGGSSNQPYIVTPIPDDLTPSSPDFLLRQGALQASLTDSERLTKFFADNSSPRGALFTAKQVALERQNPAIPGGLIRVYLPTSTLSQTLLLPEGVHLNKQGVDPFQLGYAQGGTGGYFNYTLNKDVLDNVSRLSLLFNSKISSQGDLGLRTAQERTFHISRDSEYSLSYNGGPDSIGGIGRTRIRLAGNGSYTFRDRTNTYKLDSLNVTEHDSILYDLNNVYVYDSKMLVLQNGENQSTFEESTKIISLPENRNTSLTNIVDFRSVINQATLGKANLPETPYTTFNRETTYGTSKTEYRVPNDKKTNLQNPNSSINPDFINQSNILSSGADSTKITEYQDKDLISFYFEILNPAISKDSTIQSDFLFFRAYINDLGDNYKAEWSNYKYIGRAENFYKYNGFGRDVSLGFTIYAHSRAEMAPLYQKLNRLASVTSPTYSSAGFMMGNVVKLTVGDYFKGMPGIINSINLKPSFEAGWDINRDKEGKKINSLITQTNLVTNFDSNFVGQVPRMIDVTLSFTPIHTFAPQYGGPFIGNQPSLPTPTSTPDSSTGESIDTSITGNTSLQNDAVEIPLF